MDEKSFKFKCGIFKPDPIFVIHLLTRLESKYYVFIGTYIGELDSIINKIKNGKKLTEAEKKKLKEHYPNSPYWLTLDKPEFVAERIYVDDTVDIIKNKIFARLSDPDKSKYILDKNQQLWVDLKDGKRKVLGDAVENIQPAYYTKPAVDYKFVDKLTGARKAIQTLNQSNIILMNIVNPEQIKNDTICVNDLLDEVTYLESKGVNINNNIIYGYLQKYWPNGLIKASIAKMEKDYKKINNKVIYDRYIVRLIKDVKPDSDMFKKCHIIHLLLHVNYDQKDDKIDLLKIFKLLPLSNEVPFMKYKEINWPTPFYRLYRPAVNNLTIPKKIVYSWIISGGGEKDSDVIKMHTKGLTLKFHLYNDGDVPKYATINIHKTGSMEIKLTYVDNYQADFAKVEESINKIVKLIHQINRFDYKLDRSSKDHFKIKVPKVEVSKDDVTLGKNTTISFINTITNFSKIGKIDFNLLTSLAHMMTPYVVPVLKTDKKKKEKQNTLELKYRRIDNFKNMAEIFSMITIWKDQDWSDSDIYHNIIDNFDKSSKEASLYLKEWYKQYGKSADKTGKVTQSGIYIKIRDNTFEISGARTPEILAKVYYFIVKLLTLYNQYNEYKSDAQFKKFIIEGKPVEHDQIVDFKVDQNDLNSNEIDDDVFNMDEGYNDDSISVSNYLQDIDDEEEGGPDKETLDEIEKTGDEIGSGDAEGYVLSDNIDVNITLKATCGDEMDVLKDTCVDLCDDDKYKLRRLQSYDNRLFKFKPKNIKNGYSTTCQNPSQPYVMHKNPETHPKVKKDSYSYVIKYGSDLAHQNYYLCSKVWCPYCEIPISYSDVVDIKMRSARKGECFTGKCPYGDHEVMIKKDDNKYYYPGFKPGNKHPDGLCMPCCFKTPHNTPEKKSAYKRFQECMGHKVEESEQEDGTFYILGRDKIPLTKNRYGLLPIILARKLFNSQCNSNTLSVGEACYLRQGINSDEKQSFLISLAKILSEVTGADVDKEQLKKMLVDRLTPQLFASLKNGLIKILFDNPQTDESSIDTYKSFISSNEVLNEEYLWDYVSRPGILFDEGVNIFIITSSKILCPFGENMSQIYSPDRRTIFLFKARKYYEPICFAHNNGKSISIQYLFNSLNKEVIRVFNYVNKQCKPYSGISWKSILIDNERRFGIKYNLNLKDQNTLKETVDIVKRLKLKIEGQMLDYYNKSVALILKDNVQVPVKPQGVLTDIKIIPEDDITYATYGNTTKLLSKLAKATDLNVNPIKKITDEGKVIAVLLENGRIVPVKPEKCKKDKLSDEEIPFYGDVDKVLVEGKKDIDERRTDVNRFNYENEAYQRYRFEISGYLQSDKGLKKKELISKSLKSDKSLTEKKSEIMKAIKEIESLVFAPGSVKKKIDMNNYVIPNVRVRCESLTDCSTDPYCVNVKGKCMFYVDEGINKQIYSTMILEELIRNRMKRDNILKGIIPDIINRKDFKSTEEVIALSGDGHKIIRDLSKLYAKDSKYFITKSKMYDTLEPSYPGVDRDKYADYMRDYDVDFLSLEPLSHRWAPYLTNNFSVYVNITGNSLLNTVIKALSKSKMADKVKNVLDLKNMILEQINNLTVKDVEIMYKTFDIDFISEGEESWELLLGLYQKICRDNFAIVHTLGQMNDTIISKNYSGCMIDLFMLSKALNLNFIMLNKRITKENENGFYLFGPGLTGSPFYMIIYSQNRRKTRVFDSVIGKNQYIFTKKDLPDKFINKVFGGKANSSVVAAKNVSNSNDNDDNDNNDIDNKNNSNNEISNSNNEISNSNNEISNSNNEISNSNNEISNSNNEISNNNNNNNKKNKLKTVATKNTTKTKVVKSSKLVRKGKTQTPKKTTTVKKSKIIKKAKTKIPAKKKTTIVKKSKIIRKKK